MLRPIEINDAEKFVKLSKSIDESEFMLFEPGERKTTIEQQKSSIERVLTDPKSIIFVAEVENDLVGFIGAFGSNLKRTQHSAHIVIGIEKEHQGKGIATKLFDQIMMWAKEVEISRLELTVIKSNEKALSLYKKMGFIIEGEKVHSLMINRQPINEYYLYKLLHT